MRPATQFAADTSVGEPDQIVVLTGNNVFCEVMLRAYLPRLFSQQRISRQACVRRTQRGTSAGFGVFLAAMFFVTNNLPPDDDDDPDDAFDDDDDDDADDWSWKPPA